MYDIIIVGGGAAGLTAAIYSKRARLGALLVEKEQACSGQIALTERVDNYPGLPGISGYELSERFYKHAREIGAEFLKGEVKSIERDGGSWRAVLADGSSISAKAVIFAAGASHKRLGAKGEDKRRVSYCALCDGFFYRDKTVAVIGGGDTALSEALYLSKIAETVYLIHRRDEFRANRSLQSRAAETANILPITSAVVSEITGAEKADGIVYIQNGESKTLPVDGVFCAIGSTPNSQPLRGICELDGNGHVIAGEDCRTSAKGIFAAGDVRTTPLKQIITAAADGANAVISAEQYINSLSADIKNTKHP